MPRYNSRKKKAAKRERKRVRAAVPRDKRHLSHWAVRGTHDDYAKFRKHVADVQHRAPSYLEPGAMQELGIATRRSMLENIHKEPWGGGWFTDGLSWLIDQVPDSWGWDWAKSIGQAALKPFRGDTMDETDQQYARLVDEAYKEERDPQFEHWQHMPEYDSNYVTVYDNEDGHRFIAVRGTKMNLKDVAQDWKVTTSGTPDNLIGTELRKILNDTAPEKVAPTVWELALHLRHFTMTKPSRTESTNRTFTTRRSRPSPARTSRKSTRPTTGCATSSILPTWSASATSAPGDRRTSSTEPTGTPSPRTNLSSGEVRPGLKSTICRTPQRKRRSYQSTTITMVFQTLQWLWEMITSWISGTTSTGTRGRSTSSSDDDGWSPVVRKPLRLRRVPNGKPPLRPKRHQKHCGIMILDDYSDYEMQLD